MTFQRKKEDFICEHCGYSVIGTGYTNHCPKCLWSKHVDNSPGDRSNACGGLMEPTRIEGTTDHYVIIHKCTLCSTEKRVSVAKEDDPKALVALAAKAAA